MMQKIKILIVDDEKSLVTALNTYLSKQGFEISVAYDGSEALEKISQNHPDIILLDINMPKLGGLETLKILKKQPETKDIPVIIITNYDNREKMMQTSEAGSQVYFVKSNTTLDRLSKYIHDLLNR